MERVSEVSIGGIDATGRECAESPRRGGEFANLSGGAASESRDLGGVGRPDRVGHDHSRGRPR